MTAQLVCQFARELFDSGQLKLCGEPRCETRECGNANDGWKCFLQRFLETDGFPLSRWSPGLISTSPASAMGIAESVFGLLWGSFPDISGESEWHDLPSANFDKPVQEVPLYLIADAPILCIESGNYTCQPGRIK